MSRQERLQLGVIVVVMIALFVAVPDWSTIIVVPIGILTGLTVGAWIDRRLPRRNNRSDKRRQ
jgi:uncharacterized membrane protein